LAATEVILPFSFFFSLSLSLFSSSAAQRAISSG
jgi:hypothetical protein